MRPYVAVIGGPNGAGKTTAAEAILAHAVGTSAFVNADEIARRLNPENPAAAARDAAVQMLAEIQKLRAARASFAIEATLAGRSWARHIRHLLADGYEVGLFYFWLPSPDYAVARVIQRHRAGGHFVPPADVRRRYFRSIRNLVSVYSHLATTWEVRHGAPETGPHTELPSQVPRIAWGRGEMVLGIGDLDAWHRLLAQAEHQAPPSQGELQ
jgi:predicted ABC-type ATPase